MMKEYLLDIENQGQADTIKTFAHTIAGAIDNAVCMEGVDKLFEITDTETQEVFEFDEDISCLRELRKKLPENIKMFFSIQKD